MQKASRHQRELQLWAGIFQGRFLTLPIKCVWKSTKSNNVPNVE